VDGAVDTKCEIRIQKQPHLALICNRSTLNEIIKDQKIVVLIAEKHQKKKKKSRDLNITVF
jgi:hypothetical protein